MHDPFIRKAGVSFLLLLMLATVQIPLPVHADSLNVAPLSPSNGVTITSGPVILAVRYTNGSAVVPGIQTDFYVQAPGSTTPTWVASASSDSLGAAYLPYTPPSPGSYQWSVKYYPWHNSTYVYSVSWTFNWGIPATTITQTSYATVTGTTTQWSTTAYTQTVGVVTEYSYLYETITSPTTVYRTQTVSTTRTMSSQTTIMKTSTAFATTETTPITLYQTQSTTLTETLHGTISVTQYVYIDSYVPGQVIESATIQEIPSGSEGSAHFSKSDQHKIETITIGVLSNVINVKIAIGTNPDHPSLGTNTKEYESFQIAATNLTDADVKSATIEFKVDRNWLSNSQIPQDKVSLYRLENGEWRELQTSLQRTDETYAYYEAVSPGLSTFAIAGQSTSFFQIPGVGPIASSYVMILALIVVTIIGVYGAIRIKRARSRSNKEGNGSDPALADTSSDPQIEAKLLEYITKHGGSISLSKAAEDLGVPPVTLKEAIGHLKNGGKLAPA
ncbi:MAG: PGF-pre-PGF domain-containing protein [Candidatus Bathyarchaeia archaeon]|jgi:PGF-pre-PGF domain-containing protein